jgi:hypothetical protein
VCLLQHVKWRFFSVAPQYSFPVILLFCGGIACNTLQPYVRGLAPTAEIHSAMGQFVHLYNQARVIEHLRSQASTLYLPPQPFSSMPLLPLLLPFPLLFWHQTGNRGVFRHALTFHEFMINVSNRHVTFLVYVFFVVSVFRCFLFVFALFILSFFDLRA